MVKRGKTKNAKQRYRCRQ
ncbi:MAG: hypothetical protein U1F76_11660 [Candidatus Competibacteraceae bacterium]